MPPTPAIAAEWHRLARQLAAFSWPAFCNLVEAADPRTRADLLRARFRFDRAAFLKWCFPDIFYLPWNDYHRWALAHPKVGWRDDILTMDSVTWIYGPNAWLYAMVGSSDGAGAVTVTIEGYPPASVPPPYQPLSPCGNCTLPNRFTGFPDAPQVTENVIFHSDIGGEVSTTEMIP